MNKYPTVKWHCSICKITFGEYVQAFISYFGTGKKLEKPVENISGRVLRGICEYDFVTLTDNPQRRVVFFLDAIGMSDLVGLDGKEMLKQIGYDEDLIVGLLAKETKFKLIVLPETSVRLATWDNLLNIVQEAYPEWQDKIEIARLVLKNNNYEQVLSKGGVATEVRAFLENTINVNHLFAGDGYTRREDNEKTGIYAEYVAINRPLSDFGAYALVDFLV